MTSSYLFRLLCVSLASFFLLHALLGALLSLLTPLLIRKVEPLRPREAARLLLAARLAPSTIAVFLVAGLCVPSFLRLEPETGAEEIGFLCLSAAALGMATAIVAFCRSARAIVRSRRYVRGIEAAGSSLQHAGRPGPGWIVDIPHVFISLSGIFHPRVLVSRAVAQGLSREQLAAALRHERAHRDSHDNFKRLLMIAAPDLFPFFRGFRDLERAWMRFTEWAADDRAVASSTRRSLSLAAALVRVARMGAQPAPQPLVTTLVGGGEHLSARIDRLLLGTVARKPSAEIPMPGAATAFLLAGSLLAAMVQPATMSAVHRVLESLIQ